MAESVFAEKIEKRFRGLRIEARRLAIQAREWFEENGRYFLGSMCLHAFALVCLGLLSIWLPGYLRRPAEVSFEPAKVDNTPTPELARFEVGAPQLEPSTLDTDSLMALEPPAQTAQYIDDAEKFEEAGGGRATEAKGPLLGGLGGFSLPGPGPGGRGGLGIGVGEGENFGSGGAGSGFGGRGSGKREAMLGGFGGTKAGDRAVAAALNWIARHQTAAGNWSLQHTPCCTGRRCTGGGYVHADAAATGLALCCFLAAGETHKSKGPYKQHISKGIAWLMKQQKGDGDLSAGTDHQMYSHGIATIAMCEAYGMTKDQYVGAAARKAVHFIEQAQNKETGGWRYHPGDLGDTSVTGWQMMALKSAQLAGLGVDSLCIENIRKWLRSVTGGQYGGLFCYQPLRETTPTMTAVGLLCYQYLGSRRDEPKMVEGRGYLLENLPDNREARNTYYWYYATMVMHNFVGPEWDTWNRQMRRALVETQERQGCAMGSWDPENPSADEWGGQGGRLMTTCLATLTLEVYYRYLPLFQINASAPSPELDKAKKEGPTDASSDAAKAEDGSGKKPPLPRILP